MSAYYFAYGSNMNPDRMNDRGLKFDRILSGTLSGLGLAFNKRAADAPHRAYANVIHAPHDVVEGVLYELIHPSEILKMDPFEGAPRLYSREIFQVNTDEGLIPSWVYVANKSMISEGMMPERWYLEHLLAGRPYLSDEYFRRLSLTNCLDDTIADASRKAGGEGDVSA